MHADFSLQRINSLVKNGMTVGQAMQWVGRVWESMKEMEGKHGDEIHETCESLDHILAKKLRKSAAHTHRLEQPQRRKEIEARKQNRHSPLCKYHTFINACLQTLFMQ